MGTKGKRLSNFLPQKQGLTSVDEHFPWRNFSVVVLVYVIGR
jgi:hypothetical protein